MGKRFDMCVSCVGDCGDKKLVRKNERVSSMMVLKKIIVSKRLTMLI